MKFILCSIDYILFILNHKVKEMELVTLIGKWKSVGISQLLLQCQ
jgi:hypothetical protein